MTSQRPISELKGRTVRVGIGAPQSGNSARLGNEVKQASELALEERNASGGILGAAIAGEVRDDEGRSENAAEVAGSFADDSEILGVVGHYNSDVMLASLPVYDAASLTVITPVASNPAVTGRGLPNIFRFTNRDDETGRAIANHLFHSLGKRRTVVIENTSLYGKSMAHAFVQAFSQAGGRIVARITVQEGDREFDALVRDLPRTFDLVFYAGAFEGASILRAMRAAGRHQLFAAGDGCWDRFHFLEPAGEATMIGEGVLILSATAEIGRVPGSQSFAEKYGQRYGPIGNYAVNAYDATHLLLAAIETAATLRGGFPPRRDVAAMLRRLRLPGIAYPRPVEWDDHGDNRAAVTALHVVEQGHFHEVAEIEQSNRLMPPL